MLTLSRIGLDIDTSAQLAGKLNELLANYQIFYMNLRGFHWNIKGDKFFELHTKFEELYNDTVQKIDEIAERILTLGATPLHTYSDYNGIAAIREARDISNGTEAIGRILDAFLVLIPLERSILELSSTYNDEGTNAMMSDYIREQEKLVWMYTAFLGK